MGQYLFGKFRDEAGNYVRVEIRNLGDGGDNIEEVTIRSLSANINGNPQEPYKPFSTTSGEVTLSIHRDKFWQRRLVFDLLNAGDHGFGVHIYVSQRDDIGPRSIPVFIGFIDINNLTYDDWPFPYDLKLKFYDGLASLRDIEYKPRENTLSDEPYTLGGIAWTRSVHDMIFDCINRIPNIERLIKPVDVPAVTVNCSWFASNMFLINGDLDNPLEVTAVNPFKWNNNKLGSEVGVFDNAGKVLEALLSRFQMRIYYSGTTFVLEQMSERRNANVIRHSYDLDGSNYFYQFAPGRGSVHDIQIDRIDTHRVAKGGFGYFPAAKEVRVNFNYTNDFSWVNTTDAYTYDSQVDSVESIGTLIQPKYNYDAANQRIGYRMVIRVRSDYLIPYVNYGFVHRYVFALKFLFGDRIMSDHKYNNEYLESKKSWGENRWVDIDDINRIPAAPITGANPSNPDEVFWMATFADEVYDTEAWQSWPTRIIRHQDYGHWQDMLFEGYTAPIPDNYSTGDFPLGVIFDFQGLLAQGKGNNLFYGTGANDYVGVPNAPDLDWWSGAGGAPEIFRVQYDIQEFAVFLVDENREIITDTATRVYSGIVDEKNKKVIEVDTEIGDGPGPISVSALRVLNTENDWVLPEPWTYSGVPGAYDIHELQVRELMRFYGEPRRMLTGKVWLRSSPETVYGAPFIYRFLYDNGIFLPMQATYDFQTNILEGSLMSVLGEYSTNVDVEIKDYEGVDSKLGLKGGRGEKATVTVDPAAGLGVVHTTRELGIDSSLNNGATVMITALEIPPANYGYFNKGDQIQVTDGNTGRQLIFTVDADVLPDDETITVVEQEVGIELGQNATIMLYQEHFESQAYTDNRRKYFFAGPLVAPTDRIYIPDWNLPDKSVVSTELIRKRMSVHLGSSKSIYLIPTWMGCDIDNVTNELVFNETIPAGEFVEVIYDGVRLEK